MKRKSLADLREEMRAVVRGELTAAGVPHGVECPECRAGSAHTTPVEDPAIDARPPFYGCLECGHLWARPPFIQDPSEHDRSVFRESVRRRREQGIS